MTLIAMFSDKGSPGVTTSALALAAVWMRRVAVVELDPAGGDLSLRLTDSAGRPVLAEAPNLLTLAAAARRDGATRSSLLWEHAQPLTLSPTASVVAGLSAPEQATGMSELWHYVVSAVADAEGGDVLADLGRIADTGSARLLAQRADVLVGIARAEPAAMLRLRDRLRHLLDSLPAAQDRRARVLLVAEDRHAPEAIASMRRVLHDAAIPASVVGTMTVDPTATAADALHRGQIGPRLDRSLLMRSARVVASAVDGERPVPMPSPRRRLLARAR
ncbi:MAG: hypothetical protein ACT4QF_02505 [Sporichthyaceae bacterium]